MNAQNQYKYIKTVKYYQERSKMINNDHERSRKEKKVETIKDVQKIKL